jgi:oxygen-independent coproporphyrinogen-3 oxidase
VEEGIGLYIHIPFCLARCGYCGFTSSPGRPDQQFQKAIIREIALLPPGRIRTIHAGGGTPTLMGTTFWRNLLSSLDLSQCIETAIETNPAVLKNSEYGELREAGFDRISIGVQSFNDERLKWLGRVHTSRQAGEAVESAKAGGFQNISLDLIYGLPGQTMAGWQSDLERALRLEPAHLSCYELTLEPGTRIGDAGRKACESLSADMFMETHKKLTGEGFHHYEVSNYARNGRESRHNQAYWERRPYHGAGPSAHGFTGTTRYWNTRDTARYISLLEQGTLPREGEEGITQTMALREEIMLGLRTSRGVRAGILPEKTVKRLIEAGRLQRMGTMVAPTPEGMLWADGMADELTG